MSQDSSSSAAMPETEPRLSNSILIPGCSFSKAVIRFGPSSSPNVSEPRMDRVSPAGQIPAVVNHIPATIQCKRSFMAIFLS